MVSAQHRAWLASGGNWYLIDPLVYLRDELRRAGYTVYDLGDASHLDHQPPEDHTPYSATGWPGNARKPYVHAIDIMPKMKNGKEDWADLHALAARMMDDKRRGYAPFIKYLNWMAADGKGCFQTRWMPDERTSTSTDKWHVHLSARTDYWNSEIKYSPLRDMSAAAGEDEDMGQSWSESIPSFDDLNGLAYSFSPGLVQDGSADPRGTWVSFGADTYGPGIAARIMQTDGSKRADGSVIWKPVFETEVVTFVSGERKTVELKKGTFMVSYAHYALVDGKAVPPVVNSNPDKPVVEILPAWKGGVVCLVERGPVIKK